jgi:hypothetical protein
MNQTPSGIRHTNNGEWFDPDIFYATGHEDAYTFIYDPVLGLVYDVADNAHRGMINKKYEELTTEVDTHPDPSRESVIQWKRYRTLRRRLRRENLQAWFSETLIGRSAPVEMLMSSAFSNFRDYLSGLLEQMNATVEEAFIVSFWNSNEDVYMRLPNCIAELMNRNLITDKVIISTPRHGTSIYSQAQVGTERPHETAVDDEELKQRLQLHLLRGDEKKAAMQKLGLEPASQKHPVQQSMEKGKYINPGQKWWAMHSEAWTPENIAKHIDE